MGIGLEGADWIILAQDTDRRRSFVNTEWIPLNGVILLMK